MTPVDTKPVCPICHDWIEPQKMYTHFGNGKKHPFHFECIRQWQLNSKTCPVCRSFFLLEDLSFPLKRKIIIVLSATTIGLSIGAFFTHLFYPYKSNEERVELGFTLFGAAFMGGSSLLAVCQNN